jgi:hypothetical protein
LNGLNRQFRVDVLDYGADVSIRPESISNKSTSNSNIFLKNKGTLTTQSLDFGEAFNFSVKNIGGPILGITDLANDKVIYDGWEDGGHSVVHRTSWGYYIYNDKIGTINTIRNLEQLNNYYNFGKEFGALAIGKQLFESLMNRVFKVNPIVTGIEAALVVQTTLFVPEAISQANYCLNKKEQSYLKVYYPGYLTVTCD